MVAFLCLAIGCKIAVLVIGFYCYGCLAIFRSTETMTSMFGANQSYAKYIKYNRFIEVISWKEQKDCPCDFQRGRTFVFRFCVFDADAALT